MFNLSEGGVGVAEEVGGRTTDSLQAESEGASVKKTSS